MDIYQIANIEPQIYEISLKPSNLYNEKVTMIYSRSMTKFRFLLLLFRTFDKEIFFMDDTNHEGIYKLGVTQRAIHRDSKCCSLM
jgi:hypothetical protein